MSETADFTPAHWGGGGHDFRSAYRAYDAHAGRSYSAARSANKKLADLLPKKLSTESTAPLVIVVDQTGSMGEWPKVMFSKLPYLELEGQEYLGKDMEISWCAIGDAHQSEDYPMQARPFTKGTNLKDRLMEIVIEGGGGGGGNETYELAALYLANNVEMPNAIKPICIFIGDEKPYDIVAPDMARTYAYTTLEERMTVQDIFALLKEKFSVYMVRKPYTNSGDGDTTSSFDREATAFWSELLGADHVALLPNPERVVDVIFGILAKETGRVPYFREELEARQLPDKGGAVKVATVYKSLKTVHASPSVDSTKEGRDGGKTRSKTRGLGGGKPTKPLMS